MEKEGVSQFFGRTRFVILFISHLCLTFAYSNSLVFNFTVICMDDVANSTGGQWLNSPAEVNLLFSALAIGCLIGTVPLSFLVQKIGIGKTVGLYTLLSGIATILFPLVVQIGYPAVFVARVLQGIPTTLYYPATGQIASQWSTIKGAGGYISILSTYIQFCSVITMPVAGALCNSPWGWRSAFYLFGIVSIVFLIVFVMFYHDNPEKHRSVSSRELERVSRGKGVGADKAVPYMNILREPCAWGVWLSLTGGTLGLQVFFLYGPLYMNKVLGMNVESTGFATALPFILSANTKCIMGPVSDKITFISQRIRCIIFAALSQGVMALCFVVMSLTSSSTVAQVAYTVAVVFSGVNAVGTIKCAALVFRQHIHFVMSVTSFILCFIVFLLPVAVAYACPNSSPEEWSRLFLAVAVIVALASTPFVFLAKDQPMICKNEVGNNQPRKNSIDEPEIPSIAKTVCS